MTKRQATLREPQGRPEQSRGTTSDKRPTTGDERNGKREKAKRAALMVLTLFLLFAPAAIAQQPPAAPDGFVPADTLKPQEQLPAAPLVIGAYAVAWVAVFGYLWSIWNRLGRVERDILEVSRRQAAGERR
jgi:CcmD family protein